MADNVNVTEGSGKTIATDDVGGAQYQLIKPAFGIDGAATLVSSSNPLPVVATTSGTIAVSLDPGHELGSIKGINSTVAVYFDQSSPSVSGAPTSSAVPGRAFYMGVSDGSGNLKGLATGNNFADASTLSGQLAGGIYSYNGTNWDRTRSGSGVSGAALRVVHATDVGASVSISGQTATLNVQLDPGHTIGSIASVGSITNTVAVFFSPANPAVSATFSAASIEVIPTTGSRKTMDDAHAAQRVLIVGSQSAASLVVSSITNTVAVFFSPANPAVSATFSAASIEVVPTTGSRKTMDDAHAAQRVLIAGSTAGASLLIGGAFSATDGASPNAFQFGTTSQGYAAVINYGFNGSTYDRARVNSGVALAALRVVHATDVGTSVNIIGSPATMGVYLASTAGTLGVRVGQVDGTVAVYFSQANPSVLANIQGTASIFTASGTANGVSTLGNTIISPSANYSFKIYAFSIQTTGQVSLASKFTNGAGSATEFWRPLITASAVTGVQGANLATQPGAPLFVTGTNTTLSLVLDTATLVHYSVSYTKESA